MISSPSTDATVRFSEKIIELLDEGRFSATYKFAEVRDNEKKIKVKRYGT